MTKRGRLPIGARWQMVWAIVLVGLVAGPFVQDVTSAAAPRVAATGALVDEGDVVIDGYVVGTDYVTKDGHTYSDKAPGQPYLSVPFYAAARAVGAEPTRVERIHENLTHWWLAFTGGVVPLMALLALAAVAIRRRGLPVRASVLIAMALGTLLLPFASNLYGHVLAGVFAFGAWLVLDGGDDRWRAWAAGGLLALGTTVEYQTAVVGVVLVGWLLTRRRWGDVLRFGLAAAPFGLLLLGYNTVVFGGPLESGYAAKADGGSAAFTNHVGLPSVSQGVEVLFGNRGILVCTPIVALALVGLVLRWRRGDIAAGAVGLVSFGSFFVMQASWNGDNGAWGGEMPGPRYLTTVLPFLFVGAAEAWERTSPIVRRLAAVISIGSMLLATGVFHLLPVGAPLIPTQLERLSSGEIVPTLFTMAFGSWGWIVQGALVIGAIGLLRAATPTDEPTAHVDGEERLAMAAAA